MNLRRISRWTIGLLVLLALLYAVFDVPMKSSLPSTFDSSPEGLKAFYLLLERAGIPVRRWQVPLDRLDSSVQTFVMAAQDSRSVPMAADEVSALLEWVRKGGSLIYFPSSGEPGLQKELGITRSLVPDNSMMWIERSMELQLSVRPELWDHLIETGTVRQPAECLPEGAFLYPRKNRFLKPDSERWSAIAKTSEGPIVVTTREGAGRILVASDAFLLSNLGLRKAENAKWAVCLAATLGRSSVAFDEYHLGFHSEGEFQPFFATPAARSWLLQLLLVAVVGVWGMGVRFGVPIFFPRRKVRASVEFVESVARLYEKRELAYESSKVRAEDLRRRLCAVLQIPANTPFERLRALCERLYSRPDVPDVISAYLERSRSDPGFARKSYLSFQQFIHQLRSKV